MMQDHRRFPLPLPPPAFLPAPPPPFFPRLCVFSPPYLRSGAAPLGSFPPPPALLPLPLQHKLDVSVAEYLSLCSDFLVENSSAVLGTGCYHRHACTLSDCTRSVCPFTPKWVTCSMWLHLPAPPLLTPPRFTPRAAPASALPAPFPRPLPSALPPDFAAFFSASRRSLATCTM